MVWKKEDLEVQIKGKDLEYIKTIKNCIESRLYIAPTPGEEIGKTYTFENEAMEDFVWQLIVMLDEITEKGHFADYVDAYGNFMVSVKVKEITKE